MSAELALCFHADALSRSDEPLNAADASSFLLYRPLPLEPCSRKCGNNHGLIRKYHMNLCRRCFREAAGAIGFTKVGIHAIMMQSIFRTRPFFLRAHSLCSSAFGTISSVYFYPVFLFLQYR